ncbi:anthranilate synthase component I family protein [bacterium LRH843]|nr:anthranilate synthase component I family protein [bacterium LRH843]
MKRVETGVALIMNHESPQKRIKKFKSFKYDQANWFRQYKQLAVKEKAHVLLESGRGGRYSIIGLKPFATISGKADTLFIDRQGVVETKKGPLLESLKEVLLPYHEQTVQELPPFQGGAIGYIGYDLVREIEDIADHAGDDLGLPDLYFMLFDDVFVYDHEIGELWIIVHGEDSNGSLESRIKEYESAWINNEKERQWTSLESAHRKEWPDSLSEKAFHEAVEKIKKYIISGDVFQVNLSVRQSRPLTVEPLHIYQTLRGVNPSPYMSYVHTPGFQLVSASPELLVKKVGRNLAARPIAGTRSRGKTAEEDTLLANQLIKNEKERAEHLMVVDLERNDLGKVSSYGTIDVDELMVIEKYSHVMHIVSNVRGVAADQYDLYDVIRAKFPGCTITGAPKVRTVEVIEELEPKRRGVYTGSIGWIGFNEDMELNVAIRTMICKDGYAHVQAGAGIVLDSEPKNEYKESLKKAKALWRALELSEEDLV